jgi:hypothetical protein
MRRAAIARPVVFGGALGQVDALAMLHLGGGWLDVVARAGTRLASFRYIPQFGGWLSGGVIATGVTGTPALAEMSLVTPLVSGGIALTSRTGAFGSCRGRSPRSTRCRMSLWCAVKNAGKLDLVMRVNDRLALASYENPMVGAGDLRDRRLRYSVTCAGSFDGYLDVIAPLATLSLPYVFNKSAL